ncbi:MAG: hypothetical protein IJZ25_04700 [Lachnospiraceae bacterium]|nr:hypothetical protein [Lachnospiraceae bacterium]
MNRNKEKVVSIYGVQIKYTLVPLVILNGIIVCILTAMFCYNLFSEKHGGNIPAFILLLGYLPIYPGFLVSILGGQIILAVGFVKQQKDSQGMLKLPMESKKIKCIYWKYSLMVTLASMMIHFLTLGGLFCIYRLGTQVQTYGSIDLYLAFYKFSYLVNMYPLVNPWLVIFTLLAVVDASIMSLEILGGRKNGGKSYIVKMVLLIVLFMILSAAHSVSARIFASVIVIVFSTFLIRRVYGGKDEECSEE